MRTKRDLLLTGCGMAFLVVAALSRPHNIEATPSGRVQAIEYPLPPGDSPWSLTAGSDGNLWYTTGEVIGRLTLDGTVTTFPMPNNGYPNAASAITWGGSTNLGVNAWPDVPGPCGTRSESDRITAGPDGNLWFTAASAIGRITPCGVITGFALPADWYQWPDKIIVGPDGQLWFVNGYVGGAEWISRMSLTGQFARFPTASPNMFVTDVTVGPDSHIWYAEFDRFGGVNKIVRLDLSYVFLPLVGR